MQRLKQSSLIKLSGASLKISKIGSFYKGGYDGTKNRFFYPFPKKISQEIVTDVALISKDYFNPSSHSLREKSYNNATKQYEFKLVEFSDEFKKTFNKNFYDLTVESKDNVSFNLDVSKPDGTKPDGTINWAVEKLEVNDNEFDLYGIGENKLKDLMQLLELDVGVELIDGKDKTGAPCKRLPYSFVHDTKEKLIGKPFSFRTIGTPGTTDMKYIFKSVPDFKSLKSTIDDTFNAEVVPVPFSEEKELNINDLPF